MDGMLDPVDANVQPTVSAAQAWLAVMPTPGPDTCNLAEVLGSYSASQPSTIPPGCDRAVVENRAGPECFKSTPVYSHRLVWMISWNGLSGCGAAGGGASLGLRVSPTPPRPAAPRSCHWWVPVDANTGVREFSSSSG